MEDKEFDRVMREYVSGTAKGMEKDFEKMYTEENKKPVRNKPSPRFVWALSFMLVIAITLSVALPLILTKKATDGGTGYPLPVEDRVSEDPLPGGAQTEETPVSPIDNPAKETHYGETDNLIYPEVETVAVLKEQYGMDVRIPQIETMETHVRIIQERGEEDALGVWFGLAIYDEYFDDMDVYVLPENVVLDTLTSYEYLIDKTTWEDNEVLYFVNVTSWSYEIRMFFVEDGYKYCIHTIYYEEFSAEELLDKIFNG